MVTRLFENFLRDILGWIPWDMNAIYLSIHIKQLNQLEQSANIALGVIMPQTGWILSVLLRTSAPG